MYTNYACIIACVLLNSAILIYAGNNPSDGQSPLIAKLVMLTWVAFVPAIITTLSASKKKSASFLIMFCCLLTVLSGALFTYLYEATVDPSRAIMLAPHFVLTYIFALITLLAFKNPQLKKPQNNNYVYDRDADRQISTILKMYEHGSSSAGIASTLNNNQERYLLDNSEWTKEKVDLVVNEFHNKPKLPN
ncbi:hypothetical protein [Pseudomonas sp.]|uniref:hypothetical protein n=1 Tax=Pseudomonas sp. TaxID=306 RepID=UPI003BB7DF0C